jgi:hypothetical protein
VVILSFSPKKGVEMWKKDTNSPFEVYRDPELKVYQHFKMGRSLTKLYCRSTIYWFIKTVMSGAQQRPEGYPGINDDHFQSAGDIVFNSSGEIVYEYLSDDAIKRPQIDDVLKALKK